MIEQTVKEYLDTVLEDVKVFLEIPKQMPDKFIVFQLINRGIENRINEATLEFRSYAPTKYEAALLDEKLRDAMESMHEGTDISCRLGGGNDDPDTTLKKYRYRCYYNLYY